MKITRKQLRRIIREACGLSSKPSTHSVAGIENPADHYSPEVPSPEDYDRVRDFLRANDGTVELGINMVMTAAGAGCERSTAQAIIDHLRIMTGSMPQKHRDDLGDIPLGVLIDNMEDGQS